KSLSLTTIADETIPPLRKPSSLTNRQHPGQEAPGTPAPELQSNVVRQPRDRAHLSLPACPCLDPFYGASHNLRCAKNHRRTLERTPPKPRRRLAHPPSVGVREAAEIMRDVLVSVASPSFAVQSIRLVRWT